MSFLSGEYADDNMFFFLAVVVIVPFGVGPDLKLLARIGPAMLWTAALLASLLNLDRLFRDDRDDGSLDLLVMAGPPLELTVLAKCAGAWCAGGLPLVVSPTLPPELLRNPRAYCAALHAAEIAIADGRDPQAAMLAIARTARLELEAS